MDPVDDDSVEADPIPSGESLSIDELCLRLKSGDPFARATLELHVKKLYRDNGGVQCNTSPLLPLDLNKITDDELINVCDNMMAQINRTKKADMCTRIISSTANIARLVSALTGVKGLESHILRLDNDPILKSSLLETFVGKHVTPRPMISLALCVADYTSAFLTAIVQNGEYATQLRSAFATQGSEESTDNRGPPSDRQYNSSVTDSSDG